MLISLPPGVVNEKSQRFNQANWREVNLVRWENNTLQPVKGWKKLNYTAFASPVRMIYRWSDNAGKNLIAYLCERHCYVDQGDGVLLDITPAGGIPAPPINGAAGYGDGMYNVGLYGVPINAPARFGVSTPAYTLSNWGQELRAMISYDGRLLKWDPSTPTDPLVAVDNAPTGGRSFVVTPERHIIVFGPSGSSNEFVWSDQEDDTDWTPSTTSKAGGLFVEPSSPIVAHCASPNGTVIFTNRAAYLIRYIGLPFVYSCDEIGEAMPPRSAASVSLIPDGVFWAATNGFWLYDGADLSPVVCPIMDWIKDRIENGSTRFNGTMVQVIRYFELWFFFSDTSGANRFVVIYNYKQKIWSMGELGRTCGISVANSPNPLLSDGISIFSHENGYDYPGATSLPWAETHTMNMARGARMSTIMRMLPEISGGSDSVQYKFMKRQNPSDGPEQISAPKLIKSNGYVDVRETARDFRMRIEMIKNRDWSMGPVDIEMHTRGSK